MKISEDIESFLIQMSVPYESVGEGIWLIKDSGPDIVISMAESVLVFRVKVMVADRIPAGAGRSCSAPCWSSTRARCSTAPTGWRRTRWWSPPRSSWRTWTTTSSRRPWTIWAWPWATTTPCCPKLWPKPFRGVTMGIFSRLGTLIKSNINDMISKAEDPEKMLRSGADRHEAAADRGQEAGGRLHRRREAPQEAVRGRAGKANDWERKAMMAVRAEDDNLAREALARKAEHEEAASTLEKQWILQKQAVDQAQGAACARSTARSRRPSARRTSSSRARSGPRRRRRSSETMAGLHGHLRLRDLRSDGQQDRPARGRGRGAARRSPGS